ncbi:MAG: response regulator transcription factor [Bacteroidetes bacterium]|nr:response regulator transcription factor [Bacteroidota bacterium]
MGIDSILQKTKLVSSVTHAENGEDVLKLLKKKKFDLVFMDIMMPQLDGITTTKKVSIRFPDVPVIALTSVDDRENIIKMIDAGARGYLLKSADTKEVKIAIKKILDGSHYYADEVEKNLFDRLIHKPVLDSKQSIDVVTDRLRAVVFLICYEFTTKEIADKLFVSEKTIEGYRTKLMEITNSKNIAGLVMFAVRNRITDDPSLIEQFRIASR